MWRRPARPKLDLPLELSPAEAMSRGVCRALRELGYGTLTEFRVGKGRRVDVIGLSRDSDFVIVEVKSSEADFRTDRKWQEYRPYCDRFFFAVGEDFPRQVLPEDCGIIVADAFSAAILRPAPETPLHPSRRRLQILRFALAASTRLHAAGDPGLG